MADFELQGDEDTGRVVGNIPSYMIAASNHSTANLNERWYEDNPDSDFAQRAGYMVTSSLLSGLNSFRNTAISVGNVFREEEVEHVATEDMIAGFDEDMSEYYKANRETADLVGFVATSLIPGTAGVKVFNAGAKALQAAGASGRFGANLSRGFGVLPGARQTLVAEAAKHHATTRTAFAYTNANTVKAMAAGFGENVLQSTAFEVAVVATMFKSPILEDMDVGDLMANIVTGALVGGAIGGTIDAARSVAGIKRGVKELDAKLTDVTQIAKAAEGSLPSDSLLITRNDVSTTRMNAPEGVDQQLWDNLREDKLRAAEVDSRATWGKIASNDQEIAELMHRATANDSDRALAEKVLNLVQVDSISDAQRTVNLALKKATAANAESTTSVKYLTTFGDNFGQISDDAPKFLSITDNLKRGDSVNVTPRAVSWGKNTHSIKLGESFNPLRGRVEQHEARHMWANDPNMPSFKSIHEIESVTSTRNPSRKNNPIAGGKLKIGEDDIALLGKAYREGFKDFVLVRTGKSWVDPVTGIKHSDPEQLITQDWTREQFLSQIATKKDDLAHKLHKRYATSDSDDMALQAVSKRLDVTEGWLTGAESPAQLEKAVFGLQTHRDKWYMRMHENTLSPPDKASLTPWKQKQHVGMVYDHGRIPDGIDPMAVEAMTVIMQRQKLQETINANAAAKTLGKDYNLLPEWNNNLLGDANRVGAGPTFISFANGNYGSLASFAEFVGSVVTKWTNKNTQIVGDAFASVNHQVVNNPTATAELATVFSKVRAAGEHKYVRVTEEVTDAQNNLVTKTNIVLKSKVDHDRLLAEHIENGLDEADFPPYNPPAGLDVTLPIQDPAVTNWINVHMDMNANRLHNRKIRNGARGLDDRVDSEVLYAPAPNPNRFTHHAFVIDESVRDTGHVSMLYAPDAGTLEKQINEARKAGFTTLTKKDTADYYKAKGEYEYSEGFNENYIDSTLASTGASAAHFPITGSPQEMLQDYMQWHVRAENNEVRDAVKLKYSRQLGTLNRMSAAYEGVQNSTRAGFFDRFKSQVKNPYQDYVKTMMGESRQSEYPTWKMVNETIDRAASKVWGAVSEVFSNPAGNYDLDQVNKLFDKYGMKVAATEPQIKAWVNHPAGQQAVTKFVSQQNAILSALTLRLDPVNALNNALGSTILTGAEVKSVMRAIQGGNKEAVGELAGLMNITLPGTQDMIRSPAKLMAEAYADIIGEGGGKLIERYKGANLVVDQVQQFRNLLETVTIDGTETAAQLESKMSKATAMMKSFADKGEKWTGNRFAEQMNRAVSARIMDKITGVAVKAGVMDAKTANTYINTFVNRTQANITASQRPQMFQGPLGQAIGLFQSYQFNIMQQLLRHVGEGNAKDALTLMGLQGSVYGAAGLPGYQAINTHVIGNASGNKEHKDLYTATNGALGKSLGDWVTYGLASNMFIDPDLKINLYSRGDISPRTMTVVPTNLADIPVVGAWAKVLGAAKGTLDNVQGGGDVWNSLLTGIEQQGVSRPMKGLAQALRGIGEGNMSHSQSGSGNIIAANDFLSLANLSRLSGAKPFDEAVTQDALFRMQTYQAKDRAQRDKLGKAIRTTVTGGGDPSSEQMENFMESYAKIGGTQTEFSKWYMQLIKTARTPQVNKIVENTGTSYSSYLQEIMGARMFNTPTMQINRNLSGTEE